jgi:3-hydroxybutyrate dehydrogenase
MLNRRTALVTGSVGGGLGYAIATALAQAGARVVLNDICDAETGDAAARTLAEQHATEALFFGADLGRPDEIARMTAALDQRFGGIDILVNNAVVRHFSPIEEFSAHDWDWSVAVNISAPFHLVRLALPSMKRRGWGRIINLSSYYGLRGVANRIDYVTSKTALIGMTRAIAVETAKDGITCNAVCPGSVPTKAILDKIAGIAAAEDVPVEELKQRYAEERSATGRFVSMENLGAVVVFLCSPAGADITGSVLPVDGGWLAG